MLLERYPGFPSDENECFDLGLSDQEPIERIPVMRREAVVEGQGNAFRPLAAPAAPAA